MRYYIYGLDLNDYFEYCKSRNTRTNHQNKIQTKSARVKCLKYSCVKITKPWNSLLDHVFKEAFIFNKFKKCL